MNTQEILLRTTEIAQSVLKVNAEEIDRHGLWPEASLRSMQSAGLGGLVVSRDYSGLGKGLSSLVHVTEILGRECASSAICFGMHCVGSAVIAAKANPVQISTFLEPIVQGRHLTTLSLSEPGTGSHFYYPQTEMHQRVDGQIEVTGKKTFVTNGAKADSYVISMVAEDPEAPIGEFSMAILPNHSLGMKWGPPWDGFGMRGNSSIGLELNSVVVPKEFILGQKGDQIWYVFEVVAPYFLMAMAGTYLGVADRAIKVAIQHLKERSYSHSGTSLASVNVLQHRLGVIWSRLESARQLLYSAARMGDEKHPDALFSILSAKAEVSDCATLVINETMTIAGGKGYALDGVLGRALRDARAAHVMAPTTDILRTWAGRAILGLPILGDD